MLPHSYRRTVNKASAFIRSEGDREREGGGGSAGDRDGGLGLSCTVFMSWAVIHTERTWHFHPVADSLAGYAGQVL